MKSFSYVQNKRWWGIVAVTLCMLSVMFFAAPRVSLADCSSVNPNNPCTALPAAGALTPGAANPPPANNTTPSPSIIGGFALGAITSLINVILLQIEGIIAGFLGLAGMLLDTMISYSITNLATNINAISGINTTWQLIRDLCNMSFIFILVYNGVRIMFGGGNKKIIVSVIIAAVLINFSLFFTKVIIDASNVVAVSFYNVIAPAAQTQVTIGPATINPGLSSVFMQQLNLASVYSTAILTASPGQATVNLITVLGGSFFMLIALFIFLAMAIFFLVRYLAFIFLLILSPLGFMASVIPGLSGISKKFWDTLIGQAIFAPLFMIMIYIVLVLMSSLNLGVNANIGQALTTPTSALLISAILPYILICGFLIATIILSKSYATKGGGATSTLIATGMGLAGGALFGATAAAGRNTVGRWANNTANDESLKAKAAAGNKIAQGRLALANRAASSSFDVRQSGLGKQIQKQTGSFGTGLPFAPKAGDKGYAGIVKDKLEKEKKYAEGLKPSDEAEAAAKEKLKNMVVDDSFKAEQTVAKEDHLNILDKEIDRRKKEVAPTITELDAKAAADGTINTEAAMTAKTNRKLTSEAILKDLKKKLDDAPFTDTATKKALIDQINAEKENLKTINISLDKGKELLQKKRDLLKYVDDIVKTRNTDATNENWVTPELRKVIETAGGSKANKDLLNTKFKFNFTDKSPQIDSAKEIRMEDYATALETKKTWARAWLGTPKINKQAAIAVRKGKKGKSINDLIAEKAIADAKDSGAVPPTPAAPATPPPAAGPTP